MGYSFRVTRSKLRAVMDGVYRAIFTRLDSAFPKFGWKRNRKGDWTATKWPRGFAPFAKGKDPHRLNVYENNPWTIKVHGHKGVALIRLVSKAKRLSGEKLFKAIEKLCQKAGVPFPEAALRGEAERARLRAVAGRLERGAEIAEEAALEPREEAPEGLGSAPGILAAVAAARPSALVEVALGPEAGAVTEALEALAPAVDEVVVLAPEASAALGRLAGADRARGRLRSRASETAGLGLDLRGAVESEVLAEEARSEAESEVRREIAWSRLWRSLGAKEGRYS